MKTLLALVVLVLLVGCPGPESPSPLDAGDADAGGLPPPDAGPLDAGSVDAGPTACPDGTRLCGASCVAESASSCGAACAVCSTTAANTDAVCNQGVCEERCSPGFIPCGGSCVDARTASFTFSGRSASFEGLKDPTLLRAEDVNEDGWPDIVQTGRSRDGTVTMLNHRDGGFGQPLTLSDHSGFAMEFADMNGDGRRDLLIATGESVEILHKVGPTHYAPEAPIEEGGLGLGVHDLDGDGRLDVVTVSQKGALISFTQTQSGGFTQTSVQDAPNSQLLLADVNGDGVPDALFPIAAPADADWTGGGVLVHEGLASGGFKPGAAQRLTTEKPTHIEVADLDGDGVLDIIYSIYRSSQTGLVLAYRPGKGDGTFLAERVIASGLPRVFDFTVADVNGDLLPDLLVPHNYWRLGVYLNGGGTFAHLQTIEAGGTAPAVADFNGDGLMDVLGSAGSGLVLGRIYWGQCGRD